MREKRENRGEKWTLEERKKGEKREEEEKKKEIEKRKKGNFKE